MGIQHARALWGPLSELYPGLWPGVARDVGIILGICPRFFVVCIAWQFHFCECCQPCFAVDPIALGKGEGPVPVACT